MIVVDRIEADHRTVSEIRKTMVSEGFDLFVGSIIAELADCQAQIGATFASRTTNDSAIIAASKQLNRARQLASAVEVIREMTKNDAKFWTAKTSIK